MQSRAVAKEQTRARLLDAAREALREDGPAALSLRDVARRSGIVPSAVYRHFDSRDELLTELILAAYGGLAEELESSEGGWRGAANALRTWALAQRHEFQLIYGTPVPGFRAPDRTVPAAARVAAVFVARAPGRRLESPALDGQLSTSARDFGIDPVQFGGVLADLAQLMGLIILELGGHFIGTADPADHLWRAVLDQQERATDQEQAAGRGR